MKTYLGSFFFHDIVRVCVRTAFKMSPASHYTAVVVVIVIVVAVVVATQQSAKSTFIPGTSEEKQCPIPAGALKSGDSVVEPCCRRNCRIECDSTGGGPICYKLCRERCLWP